MAHTNNRAGLTELLTLAIDIVVISRQLSSKLPSRLRSRPRRTRCRGVEWPLTTAQAVIVRLVAVLKRVHSDMVSTGFQHAREFTENDRRTLGGTSWNMKMLVTASWLSSGSGIDSGRCSLPKPAACGPLRPRCRSDRFRSGSPSVRIRLTLLARKEQIGNIISARASS